MTVTRSALSKDSPPMPKSCYLLATLVLAASLLLP